MRKRTAENPSRNADLITGAVGGQEQEIRPVKQLNFKPITIKRAADNADYSDKIDTDDEIKEILRDIEVSNEEALSNAEQLADER